jgi:erythromycin esterase-like protein/predicted phosphoribosyltransferase
VVERFSDRAEAGRLLAERLQHYAVRDDVIVLGLPRGGVPVAFEVAKALGAPLDVYLVRKLGVPGNEELAFGAIATGGTRVLNENVGTLGIPQESIEAVDAQERRELERREQLYRRDLPPPGVGGNVVILVDDGLATGASMTVAVRALRRQRPERIVVAVPVAPDDVCENLRDVADEVVCLVRPRRFRRAVGAWYENFEEVTDDQVRELLDEARHGEPQLPGFAIHPLKGESGDYDGLIERARHAQFVLVGEASHGTHEFYRERAEITKRLIDEAGFNVVAVEADWPDAYRVNRFVRGASDDADADGALAGFRRFPTWMWRNTVVAEFAGWLRERNDSLPPGEAKTGFYGLDLYSLYSSMDAVISYLEEVDPEAAERARERYSCFDHFSRDPQVYSYETGLAGAEPCEQQAVEQLIELRELTADVASRDGHIDADQHFYAEQNARLVANAEEYYRAAFQGGVRSWNLRDSHMAETLDELVAHLERTQGPTRAVVWAHNSHLGDARATELGEAGELNLGQLVRQRHPAEALNAGFSTYTGSVTAANDWGGPAERLHVLRALPGSWEELFHRRGVASFLLDTAPLEGRRLERAIGVVYRPQTERWSHYFHAQLAAQFDMLIHLDETSALEPLADAGEWDERRELPETYPWGV